MLQARKHPIPALAVSDTHTPQPRISILKQYLIPSFTPWLVSPINSNHRLHFDFYRIPISLFLSPHPPPPKPHHPPLPVPPIAFLRPISIAVLPPTPGRRPLRLGFKFHLPLSHPTLYPPTISSLSVHALHHAAPISHIHPTSEGER